MTLLQWLAKRKAPVVCTSVDAFLMFKSVGLENPLTFVDLPLPAALPGETSLRFERLARDLDAATSTIIASQTGLAVSGGWEFWDKWLFALSLWPWRDWSFKAISADLPTVLAVCCYANPQDYFHPSFVRSGLIAKALGEAGCKVVRIPLEYPLPPPHRPDVWGYGYRMEVPKSKLQGAKVVHLPTALYAVGELREAYECPGFLHFESPYYEAVFAAGTAPLTKTDRARDEHGLQMAPFAENYRRFLADLGFAAFPDIERQVDHWLARLSFQFRAFRMLSLLRARFGVGLAAITDHDAGLFGPICSAFASQEEPVRIVPHSTIAAGPLPRLNLVVEGWIDSMRPLPPFDGGVMPKADFTRLARKTPERWGEVALVLNEMDHLSGLPTHSLASSIGFVQSLALLLRGMGLVPVLRPRFSSPLQAVHDFGVEIHQGDLQSLIDRASICIGIGLATTATTRFWREGVACVQVQETELSSMDLYTLPREGMRVFAGRPFAESLPAVLDHLDALIASRQPHPQA